MTPDIARRIVAARVEMLLSEPFFGSLALRLDCQERPDVTNTMATDGVMLAYNPDFITSISQKELVGVIAHEVLHCAHGHMWRRNARDFQKWNVACDLAINQILVDACFTLPKGILIDSQFSGMSAEAIYSKLPDSQYRDLAPGEVLDTPATPEQVKGEWDKSVLIAASQAKQAGKLPAGIARALVSIKQPACASLLAALQDFVTRAVSREDYSWSAPNRRYPAGGLYMPSLTGVQCPPIVACVDTSCSISDSALSEYVNALQVVFDEMRPERLIVLSCDTQVYPVAEYEPGDSVTSETSAYKGGGGTDFRPVFDYITKLDCNVACLIYFTDLFGTFPPIGPDYPTLWVVNDCCSRRTKAPFGTTIWFD